VYDDAFAYDYAISQPQRRIQVFQASDGRLTKGYCGGFDHSLVWDLDDPHEHEDHRYGIIIQSVPDPEAAEHLIETSTRDNQDGDCSQSLPRCPGLIEKSQPDSHYNQERK
jgi:hypothetical protein